MTVTAIQIGLDPDVIDYSSADFAQFPGLSKEKLRAANDQNVAGLRAAGYHVDNCLIDVGPAGADTAASGWRPSTTTQCSSAPACGWSPATHCCSSRSSTPRT
jgi:hypothetical protein